MKKILLVLFGLSILLPAASAQEAPAQEDGTDDFTRLVQNQDSLSVATVSAADADSAYIQGDYLTAIDLYQEVLRNEGVSATLCMNLGNSYFKLDEIAQAILWYERAYLLDPSDDDVKFNLELARTRTVDKVTPKNQLFIVVWFRNLVAALDINTWAALTLLFFFVAALMAGVFLLSRKVSLKKISFAFSLFFFVFSILSFIFASTQRSNIVNRDTAIIVSPSVTVKSTPSDSGTDLFIIHEGRKVDILDSSMKEWVEIRLEDGNTGWVLRKVMEII
ncbi:MAG: tetratricopeptide repeat protein [Bacteroidaceae bacterium]|nr:tetratricopeptide repeat protein [Bacteroidaceae bacterium]